MRRGASGGDAGGEVVARGRSSAGLVRSVTAAIDVDAGSVMEPLYLLRWRRRGGAVYDLVSAAALPNHMYREWPIDRWSGRCTYGCAPRLAVAKLSVLVRVICVAIVLLLCFLQRRH